MWFMIIKNEFFQFILHFWYCFIYYCFRWLWVRILSMQWWLFLRLMNKIIVSDLRLCYAILTWGQNNLSYYHWIHCHVVTCFATNSLCNCSLKISWEPPSWKPAAVKLNIFHSVVPLLYDFCAFYIEKRNKYFWIFA